MRHEHRSRRRIVSLALFSLLLLPLSSARAATPPEWTVPNEVNSDEVPAADGWTRICSFTWNDSDRRIYVDRLEVYRQELSNGKYQTKLVWGQYLQKGSCPIAQYRVGEVGFDVLGVSGGRIRTRDYGVSNEILGNYEEVYDLYFAGCTSATVYRNSWCKF